MIQRGKFGLFPRCHTFFYFFIFLFFYCVSSDFSDLQDMTNEYIDLSVYALTGLLLYIILYLTLYTKVKCMKSK